MKDEDLLRMFNQQNAAMAGAAPKKNAGMLGTILSTVGGIAGGIGGGFLGSAVPVAGTAAGAIAGGSAGSAGGRWLANLLTGTDAGEGVVEDAAFGAIGGGLGKVLKVGKGAVVANNASKAGANAVGAAPKTGVLSRFKTNVGGKVEDYGNKLMASQANLTRSGARNLDEPVAQTFGKLNQRTGLGNMDDLAELSKGLTGREGLVSIGVDDVAGRGTVKLDGMRRAAEDALIDRGIPSRSPAAKEVLENVQNQVVKANGGSAGSLSDVVGGKDALKAQRFLAENASINKQGFKRSGDPKAKQVGEVYTDLSNFVKDRLYGAPGIVENFATKGGGKDQIVQSLKAAAADDFVVPNPKVRAAYSKLANEFEKNVKNIGDARSFQADFVRLNKIAEKTAEATNGAAAQLMDTKAGLGKFLQNPLNILAEPAESMSGKIGGKLASTGRALQGQADEAATAVGSATRGVTKGDVVKSAVAQTVPRAMFGGGAPAPVDPATAAAMTATGAMSPEQIAPDGSIIPGDPTAAAAGTTPTGETLAPGAPFSKESLDQAIVQAANAGDSENVNMLMKLGDYYYPAGAGAALSPAGQKSLQSMNAAGQTVDTLESILAGAGAQNNGVLANIFGGIQGAAGGVGLDENARMYESQAGSAATQLARAISGETGTMTDQDIQRAKAMVPKLTDSAEVRARKFSILRDAIANNQQSAMSMAGMGGGQPDLSAMFGGM